MAEFAIVLHACIFAGLGVLIGWYARAMWGGDYRAGLATARRMLVEELQAMEEPSLVEPSPIGRCPHCSTTSEGFCGVCGR